MNAAEQIINYTLSPSPTEQIINYTISPTSYEQHRHETSIIPITFWIFLSVETLVTILGNATLCWLFLGNKKLRTNQNYFIVSLSVSDLFVGLSIVPCEYCRYSFQDIKNDKKCPLFCGSIISFNMIASVINLVLISSDRYLAVSRPYQYLTIFTKRRAITIIIISWITTIVLSCIPIIWSFEDIIDEKTGTLINVVYTEILFTLTIVAGSLLAVFYYTIVQTIRSKVRQSKEPLTNPAGIWVCIISSIIFVTSWIPYCIVEILLQHEINISLTVMDAAYFILMLNPCLNPVIYAYYRRDFRSSIYTRRRDNVFLNQTIDLISVLKLPKDNLQKEDKTSNKDELEESAFIVQSYTVAEKDE